MAANFNDTTPVAPANTVNVAWQSDGAGNVSANVPAGVSLQSADNVDLTAQGANISATTILTPGVAGIFRISVYIAVTRAATISSTLPSVTITFTDADSGQAQSITVTPTNAGNALTTLQEAVAIINADTVAIQYATASFATSGTTSMQYALHIRTEAL